MISGRTSRQSGLSSLTAVVAGAVPGVGPGSLTGPEPRSSRPIGLIGSAGHSARNLVSPHYLVNNQADHQHGWSADDQDEDRFQNSVIHRIVVESDFTHSSQAVNRLEAATIKS